MKRTNTILFSLATVVLTVAVIAGPATAATGYDWLNKSGEPTASQAGHSSINAILGASESTAGAVGTDLAAVPHAVANYRSLNSIVGSEPVPGQTVSVVHEDNGFSWGDAFIGAGGAFLVLLISAMALYELRRHRRVTVASGV